MIGKNMSGIDAAGSYPRPKAGGYIIRITRAVNNPSKERTEFEFDIADGQFKDYYKDLHERAKFWGGVFYKSYTDKALPFYKGFTRAIVDSNENTDGLVIGDYEDVDETKFVGKLVGMAIGEKEYMGNDGTIKTKLDTYNAVFTTVTDIEIGNYKVPDFIPFEEGPSAGSATVVDTTAREEIPEGFKESAETDPF